MNHSIYKTICELGLKSQELISISLDFGLIGQAREIKCIDGYLRYLLRKNVKFDFVAQVAKGKTLLVGEGNLSFALSLARKQSINPAFITATTFEKVNELSQDAKDNAKKLRILGAEVLHGINASKIADIFSDKRFETIIFQFPHAGSREPIDDHNPNFILVSNFLNNAARLLVNDGAVLISAVDSPHYHGAFQFEDAAKEAGFAKPTIYPFEPSDFIGYEHTMTHQSGSALENHDKFSTWVFHLE
ncbi:MAG: class I SAM-dependent methyltransferase [Rickettsiales bacterium]